MEQNKQCPVCGKGSPEGSKFCMHCGAKFTDQNTDNFFSQQKQCPCCGESIPSAAVHCPNCGEKEESPAQQSSAPKSNDMAIAGFILSFFSPILGLIFSIIGEKNVADDRGYKFARAGFIISVVSLIISIVAGIIVGINYYAYFATLFAML